MMSEVSVPYHLIIPFLLSFGLLCLGIKKIIKLKNSGRKRFLIAIITFCSLYSLTTGYSAYESIVIPIKINRFDLNNDGMISDQEETKELETLRWKLISDTARNFSFITGFIFSFIFAVTIYLILTLNAFILGKLKLNF